MATEVTLPQLGESVTEGTITAWLVSVGDEVQADQPLFELSSDKIDTEVPAPAGGVVQEIHYGVDETVEVGAVVAVIGEGAPDDGAAPEAQAGTEEAEAEPEPEPAEGEAAAPAPEAEAGREAPPEPEPSAPAAGGDGAAVTEGTPMSPIVRRLIREHGLDAAQIPASGQGGRITREDVESVISSGAPAKPAERAEPAEPAERAEPAEPAKTPEAPARAAGDGERERLEDLSRIRRRIAARMRESLEQTAQLTTVQEADVTAIMRLREQHKDTFRSREGASLSPFVFLARAAVLALKRHPYVNAQADWEAGKVKVPEYVNLGIAVDTEKGLLVPNVKGADDLTLPALARGISQAADKARGKGTLEMHDIEGGTFTVTNTGSRGVLLDTPILNYPEVAILATGAIQRRPVVVDDPDSAGPAIAVRDMVYLCLTYDHQLLDGADAARYVTDVKQIIETHDWAAEIGY